MLEAVQEHFVAGDFVEIVAHVLVSRSVVQVFSVFNCFGQDTLEVVGHFAVTVVAVSRGFLLLHHQSPPRLPESVVCLGNLEHFLEGKLAQPSFKKPVLEVFSLLRARGLKHRNLKSRGGGGATRLSLVLTVIVFKHGRVVISLVVLRKVYRADGLYLFFSFFFGTRAFLLRIHMSCFALRFVINLNV